MGLRVSLSSRTYLAVSPTEKLCLPHRNVGKIKLDTRGKHLEECLAQNKHRLGECQLFVLKPSCTDDLIAGAPLLWNKGGRQTSISGQQVKSRMRSYRGVTDLFLVPGSVWR